jgi:PTS system mannitol-specific IIC component
MCLTLKQEERKKMLKQSVQKFGRALSGMVMPNIGGKAESKGVAAEETKTPWKNAETTVGNTTASTASAVRKIVFACDAGMGSSAMGATKLRKKIQAAGITDIAVIHSPVSEVPADADMIICHRELEERARNTNPKARLITITDFLGAPEYEEVVNSLKNGHHRNA